MDAAFNWIIVPLVMLAGLVTWQLGITLLDAWKRRGAGKRL